METTETEVSPVIYSYEELIDLWESDLVKRHHIIDHMGRLLRQGDEDASEAETFLRGLSETCGGKEKKHVLEVLRGKGQQASKTTAPNKKG